MTKIAKTFTFEAGHRLRRHDGKCQRLHGHSYKVQVQIDGDVQEDNTEGTNPQTGMVFDFSKLKEWWKVLEDTLDHFFLLERGDPAIEVLDSINEQFVVVDFAPTAENIAGWILEDLQNWLLLMWPEGFPTPKVRVWETASSWAEA